MENEVSQLQQISRELVAPVGHCTGGRTWPVPGVEDDLGRVTARVFGNLVLKADITHE